MGLEDDLQKLMAGAGEAAAGALKTQKDATKIRRRCAVRNASCSIGSSVSVTVVFSVSSIEIRRASRSCRGHHVCENPRGNGGWRTSRKVLNTH